MKAAKLKMNDSKSFDVFDTRNGKTLKRNMKGDKAVAYVEYYDQEIKKAEAAWAEFDKKQKEFESDLITEIKKTDTFTYRGEIYCVMGVNRYDEKCFDKDWNEYSVYRDDIWSVNVLDETDVIKLPEITVQHLINNQPA